MSRPAAARQEPPRRLVHFTPLRYPGGKAKLVGFVKRIMDENDLLDGEYVEPYAGGAGIALELLFHEYVSHVHINDISRPVYAFWRCVLHRTDELVRRIRDTPLTVATRDRQKRMLMHQDEHDELDLGFATFFLNRTNRSGILNGGIIGGRAQTGPWKMDARYNAAELTFRIESIARMRHRISLTRLDALAFLRARVGSLPRRCLIYLDPPYYLKGKDLYYDYYDHDDHVKIAKFVCTRIRRQRWIVSYDNVPEVRALYPGFGRMTYRVGYSARRVREGTEVMFFCPRLSVPEGMGAMKVIRRVGPIQG